MKRLALLFAVLAGSVALVATSNPAVAAPPTTVTGRVIDSASGAGVGGVIVSLRDVLDHSVVYAHTKTGPNGYFKMTNVYQEEFGVRFNGSSVHYETGWLSCSHTVVPTWGAACSAGPGALGNIKLDHL
jgi:hypothetical protein